MPVRTDRTLAHIITDTQGFFGFEEVKKAAEEFLERHPNLLDDFKPWAAVAWSTAKKIMEVDDVGRNLHS